MRRGWGSPHTPKRESEHWCYPCLEGRGEPFRARVFAEPAPFAALRAGFQRTDHIPGSHFRSVIAATTRTPASLAAAIDVSTTPNGSVESAFR